MDISYSAITELLKSQSCQARKPLTKSLEKKIGEANEFLSRNGLPELEIILLKKEFELLTEKRPNEGVLIGEYNFTFRERIKIAEASPRFALGRQFILTKANQASPAGDGTEAVAGPSCEEKNKKICSPQLEDELLLHPSSEEVLIDKSPKTINSESTDSDSDSSSSSSESESETENEQEKKDKEERKMKRKMKKKKTDERLAAIESLIESTLANSSIKSTELSNPNETREKSRPKESEKEERKTTLPATRPMAPQKQVTF